MIISIPTKAKDKYIQMCHDAFDAPTYDIFYTLSEQLKGYGDAIKDICGINVFSEIGMEADRSFLDGVDTCAGVPLTYKKAKQ